MSIDVKHSKTMAVDLAKEEQDIDEEMNDTVDENDTDYDLLIQALRERIRAAAYIQALGQKLPFGFHFALLQNLPLASENQSAFSPGKNVPCVLSNGTPGRSINGSKRSTEAKTEVQACEEGELPQGTSIIDSIPPPEKCPICGDKDAMKDLNTHVKVVHGIEGVVCPHCGKVLSKACTLNRHIEQVHLNLQIHKPAKCHECGKIFSKKGHLDRHVRTIHLGIKDSSEPCPYCGKVFSTKSSLEPHIDMVHRGVRRECPECGKVLSDLWKHMRTVHGLYRRKAKIPKDEAVVKNVSSPSKNSVGSDSTPVSPSVDKTLNNNDNSDKSNESSASSKSAYSSKNKRKSSPPVKVKLSFNGLKFGKKLKTGKN